MAELTAPGSERASDAASRQTEITCCIKRSRSQKPDIRKPKMKVELPDRTMCSSKERALQAAIGRSPPGILDHDCHSLMSGARAPSFMQRSRITTAVSLLL